MKGRRALGYSDTHRTFWKAAGYRTDLGSAATGMPPPKPYIRLYHLCPAVHALTNIARERIKLTRISEANDPFELLALNFREGGVRSVVKAYRAALDSRMGFLSFSADWTSPLLWSHYADSHRGICLGFDVLRSTVEKVEYRDERILAEMDEANGYPFELSEELQEKLRRTKCHEWKYEQEYRRFLDLSETYQDGKHYFYPLNVEVQLAEVIAGPNCEIDLQSIRASVKSVRAKTFSARLAWKHFKVVPRESTVL